MAKIRHGLITFLVLLTMPALASAQSIVDPTIIEFAPSAAPSVLDVRTGTPLVQKYTLDIYLAGTSTLIQTVDLGNPLPASDGLIRVDFVALLATPLSTGVIYDSVVNVIGPVDARASARSQTFAYSTPCTTPTISPSSANFSSAAATTGSVAVTAAANCTWNATSNAAWITITANAFGTGNATVTYTVAANTSPTTRTGTMTIGGQTFTVTQAGAPCTFTLSSSSANFIASGGSGTVTVTGASGCGWTATSNAAWLTVANGAAGNGNGTVTYNVAANTGSAARTGILTIAGQSFSVTQTAPSCVSLISPMSSTLTAAIAASGSITVTASAGCSWTAVSNVPWITVSVGATGTGNGYVAYGVSSNTGSAARTGAILIGGYVFTITQPGAPCSFILSPLWSNLTSSAAVNGVVTVSSGSGCSWTATSNVPWITITSGASGTGNGSVNYAVASNTGTASRSGTMVIAGATYTVSQPGSSCSFAISPTSQAFGASGGSGTVTVTTSANCSWTASSNAAWVTISSSAAGSGSGTVAFSVAPNTGTVSRTATLTVGGKSFTVTEGGPCSFVLAPWLISAPPSGISGSITVTTQPGCSWTATTSNAWITVSGSGVGSGTATYTIQPNTGALARSGAVNIGNVSVSVNQAQ